VNRHGNRITRTRKTRFDIGERKASIQMRTGGEYHVECAFVDGTESNCRIVSGVEVESWSHITTHLRPWWYIALQPPFAIRDFVVPTARQAQENIVIVSAITRLAVRTGSEFKGWIREHGSGC
jgi:hypothetical protein